jgi:hypothetical protein
MTAAPRGLLTSFRSAGSQSPLPNMATVPRGMLSSFRSAVILLAICVSAGSQSLLPNMTAAPRGLLTSFRSAVCQLGVNPFSPMRRRYHVVCCLPSGQLCVSWESIPSPQYGGGPTWSVVFLPVSWETIPCPQYGDGTTWYVVFLPVSCVSAGSQFPPPNMAAVPRGLLPSFRSAVSPPPPQYGSPTWSVDFLSVSYVSAAGESPLLHSRPPPIFFFFWRSHIVC